MTQDTDGSLMTKYASGPFVIKSYTPEESMVWVKNPNYNAALGDRGHAAEIDFTMGVDPAQAALKIKAGDIDLYTGNFPAADVVPAVQGRQREGARSSRRLARRSSPCSSTTRWPRSTT